MKKTIINIVVILTFFIIYFLQLNFFSWFKIAGVMPNLFVILVLFIALFSNKAMGVTYGVIFGLFLDLFIGKKIGMTAIVLGSIGLIGSLFDKNFSKDSRITIMIMVMVSTLIYEIGMYILSYIMFKINIDIIAFIKILIIEVIYNIILTIILYPLIQRAGFYIESKFKENKILTKYF